MERPNWKARVSPLPADYKFRKRVKEITHKLNEAINCHENGDYLCRKEVLEESLRILERVTEAARRAYKGSLMCGN